MDARFLPQIVQGPQHGTLSVILPLTEATPISDSLSLILSEGWITGVTAQTLPTSRDLQGRSPPKRMDPKIGSEGPKSLLRRYRLAVEMQTIRLLYEVGVDHLVERCVASGLR